MLFAVKCMKAIFRELNITPQLIACREISVSQFKVSLLQCRTKNVQAFMDSLWQCDYTRCPKFIANLDREFISLQTYFFSKLFNHCSFYYISRFLNNQILFFWKLLQKFNTSQFAKR